MKTFLIIILSLFLQSCASTIDMPVVDAPAPVKIETATLTLCATLNEDITVTQFEEVVIVYSDLATMYATCANKQADSVKLLKKFGGIK